MRGIVCWLWKVSCKSKVGSIRPRSAAIYSICLNELLVGLDLPLACIDGQGGAFWARRGTEPKMQCSCLSILFAMIF